MMRVVGWLFLGMFLSSCAEPQMCTLMACSDQAGVTLQTANGQWQAGQYDLKVVFDSVTGNCSFTVPDAGPPGRLVCDGGIEARLAARIICPERGGTCAHSPDQFDLEVSKQGVLSAVSVELKFDGAVLVNAAHALAYQDVFPNGPDCGGACRQASLTIAMP